ncbi:MAG: F0F1 ATP synthase subunit B [Patescibacteria group bacterium]|jgi:F-type H+-transporting ATPase subunit b
MEILNSFGVDWKLLVASTINFVILLFLLNKIVYKPLLQVMDERKNKIDESLKNAETIEKKLAETTDEQQKILHQARIDAEQLIAKAENQAKSRQLEILDLAKEQSAKMISQTEAKLSQQASEIKKQIQSEAADLVMLAVKSILLEKMPTSIEQKYIETTLKAVGKKNDD